MMEFILILVGVSLIALSLVITIAILKAGWDVINSKKPPDSKADSKKSDIGGKDA